MSKETAHTFATEFESAEGITWTVGEEEMLCDIKKLLSEYYLATFSSDGKSLNISLAIQDSNLQGFGGVMRCNTSSRRTHSTSSTVSYVFPCLTNALHPPKLLRTEGT